TINQLRPILVRFAVPSSNLPALRRYADHPLPVRARPGVGGAGPLDGVLAFMDNHVDSTTGTVLLKGRFANADGQLWPGEFVDVTLILAVEADALVIPAQAVLTSQQGTYVFIVNGDGSATQPAVTVARTAGGEPPDDGGGGRDPAREAVLDHRRARRDDLLEHPRQRFDHTAVHAVPRHRRRRPGRAGGDLQDAAAAAPGDSAPVVSEGES